MKDLLCFSNQFLSIHVLCAIYGNVVFFFIFRFVPCGMTASCVDISLCHDV